VKYLKNLNKKEKIKMTKDLFEKLEQEFTPVGTEIVEPDWYNENIIKPKKYFRIHIGNSRYYYDNPLAIKLRKSVTTLLHSQMPMNPFLRNWLFRFNSVEEYEAYMKGTADYGTIMHVLFTKLLLNKEVNVVNEVEYLKEQLNTVADININELKKDVICFVKFIEDYKVKPIAVELPVMNDRYAGTIDLLCCMWINDEMKTCLIDYKSGRKGFYDSHRVQLHAYKQLIKECYDIDIDLLFNFAPSDFTKDISKHSIKQPIYKLENQSNEKYTQMWELYCKLDELNNDKTEIKRTSYADVINFENVNECINVEFFNLGV
jgi:hypothetical protein